MHSKLHVNLKIQKEKAALEEEWDKDPKIFSIFFII